VSRKNKLQPILIMAALLSIILTGMHIPAPVHAQAENPPPASSDRTTVITVDYTLYKWWLINWADNMVQCEILVEHDGAPLDGEISYSCGSSIHDRWLLTTPCDNSNQENRDKCDGVYLFLAQKTPSQRQVTITLPPPAVWITLAGCKLETPQNRCTTLPSLLLSGEESLPNETVIRIQGLMNGKAFSCAGSQCAIPLQPTGGQGQTVEFWADSSYGDSSDHYTAMVRVRPWGDFMAPEGETHDSALWYVDVLSSQWRGARPASCSDTWQVFPDVGGPPEWLTTPNNPQDLTSNDAYYYLAGMLIRNGAVDASACPDGGMQDGFIASQCGLDVAAPKALEWQNHFDSEIMKVAQETGVPAQLMKNIFSRESQFWPGIYQNLMETGLGQMTEKGADTVLLWNPTFFNQFCPLVLHKDVCQAGWGNLSPDSQNLLRGALVKNLNATCVDCPVGINLNQASFSIKVFAETLLGNCEQAGNVIGAASQQSPGQVSTYADLWRFTLVNYNAGPGCLLDAAGQTHNAGESLDWEHLKGHLAPACQGAIGYVEDISKTPAPAATPTPIINLEETAQPNPEEIVTPEPTAEPEELQPTETPLEDGEDNPFVPTEEPEN
jgi:hypothetical protein